ncbi:hypothetical protein Tco_0713521, partial [Tanacetum coccineum]
MGEGSTIPTNPHHTPTFIQPSTQPQKTQQPRKPKRKDTQVPQPSDPIENVADEAVHKELGDSLVRAATTASSLEAEQDSGNINKTQSKATPNESSSQRTNSGGGPWCQETMGVTIAQTRLFARLIEEFGFALHQGSSCTKETSRGLEYCTGGLPVRTQCVSRMVAAVCLLAGSGLKYRFGNFIKISNYCRGKKNGVNILKLVDEGSFQMGTIRDTLTEGTE